MAGARPPWGEVPPIPETRGGAQKQARRKDVWRSVITQQLQADAFAVEMAAQLFQLAPHHEAKLYYSTMVQDESRHTEAWLKLAEEAGGTAERDPHLDRLARMFLDLQTLEEKVFLMQVFFERLIIPRFRLIARSSRGTVLEDLQPADRRRRHPPRRGDGLRARAARGGRPEDQEAAREGRRADAPDLRRARALAPAGARADRGRDAVATSQRLRADLDDGVRLANSLGLDVSQIALPV